MRRAALLVVVGFVLAAANVAQAGEAGDIHYPDLRTLQPSDLKIQRDRPTGQKLLLFSNTVANLGPGPLELEPVNNAFLGTTEAYQHLYTHDSNGDFSFDSEVLAGKFDFHPAHGHWHFEGFATYELYAVDTNGNPGAFQRSSEKVSFCIIDTGFVDGTLEHSSGQTYTSCGQSVTQGLSVGWSDKYSWYLAGQSVNITGLANGDYWLLSTVDPEDLLQEGGGATETNNTAAVKIRIRANGVKILP